MTAERSPVVYVVRRHGAWLVNFVGEHPGDRTEDENFDCASSLDAAKRIAKEGARQYASNFRWVERPDVGGWVLEGVEDEWKPGDY